MTADIEAGCHAELDDDRARLGGGGFGVAFQRQGGCWTETIGSFEPRVELAMTHAASEDAARVAHPVYQEVQLHGPADGPSLCLLLTGLWSHHHFSAAVTLSRDPAEAGRMALDFDVADRCRRHVESLAATYVIALDSGTLVAAGPERVVWDVVSGNAGRLELVAGPRASLTLAEAGRTAMRVQILAAIQPGAFTHRLRYGWRWTSADGLTR